MKINCRCRFFLLALLGLLVVLTGCQEERIIPMEVTCEKVCESEEPKIVFISTEHDFGQIDAGAKKTCAFEFINDGGKDLVIEKVRASCGCTTTTTTNTTVKPGQASEIAVAYKAGTSGKSKKRIMVYTNDPETPQVTLWVS